MEILNALKDFGIPVATAIAGWLAGRPKEKVDIEAAQVDNAGKVIDKWSGYSERLEKNIEQLSGIIDDLREALNMAKDEKLACKRSLEMLQIEYDKLLRLYEELSKELTDIKSIK